MTNKQVASAKMEMIPTMMPMMAARESPLDEAESVSLVPSLGEALKA